MEWLLVAALVASGSIAILWYLRPQASVRSGDELRRYCIDRDKLLRRYAEELRSRGLLP